MFHCVLIVQDRLKTCLLHYHPKHARRARAYLRLRVKRAYHIQPDNLAIKTLKTESYLLAVLFIAKRVKLEKIGKSNLETILV